MAFDPAAIDKHGEVICDGGDRNMAADGMGSAMKVSTWISGLAVAAVMAVSVPVTAQAGSESGNFMIRMGASAVLPDSKVTTTINDPGEITDKFIPSATLTYFLSKNLAVELFCCFSTHQVDLNTAGKVAHTWIFPPTLTLQYHFDHMGPLKPYVGAGVTWMHFFKEKGKGALAGANVDIDDAFGFALQAGVDISMGGGWYLNADVKKIFIETDARAGAVGVSADIDPWIISANIGYRFNLGDLFHRTSHEPLK